MVLSYFILIFLTFEILDIYSFSFSKAISGLIAMFFYLKFYLNFINKSFFNLLSKIYKLLFSIIIQFLFVYLINNLIPEKEIF